MAISSMQTLHDALIALTATMSGAVALAIVIIAVFAIVQHGKNPRSRSQQLAGGAGRLARSPALAPERQGRKHCAYRR
jgi:hypothetical protein